MTFLMNLKHIADENLLSQTKTLVAREGELVTQVLWHLRVVERSRLFAGIGYASLVEYAVKELGYSEASAMRRIGAMRLLRETLVLSSGVRFPDQATVAFGSVKTGFSGVTSKVSGCPCVVIAMCPVPLSLT